MMGIKKVVARTNDPWENLRILRELKRKFKAKYTTGLINTDKGEYYCVSDAGSIYCLNKRNYSGRNKSDFNVEEYFKNSNRLTFKGDTVYFSTADCSEGGQLNYNNFGGVGKGIYIDDVEHHTFIYSLVKTDDGLLLIRKSLMHKNKDILLRIMSDKYRHTLECEERGIENLKKRYNTFIKQLEDL